MEGKCNKRNGKVHGLHTVRLLKSEYPVYQDQKERETADEL
jgi:hypothetical protein